MQGARTYMRIDRTFFCCWQGIGMQVNAYMGINFFPTCAVCWLVCCDVMLCDARLHGSFSFQFFAFFILLMTVRP